MTASGAGDVRVGVDVVRRRRGSPSGCGRSPRSPPGSGCASSSPTRFASLPAFLAVASPEPSGETSATPAESYPRYSRRRSPSRTTSSGRSLGLLGPDVSRRFRTWRASLPAGRRAAPGPRHGGTRHRAGLARARPRAAPWRPCRRRTCELAAVAPPYVELDREAWTRLSGSTPLPLTDADVEHLRGLGRPDRPRRGGRGLPAAVPAAQPVRRGDAPPARGVVDLPARGLRRHAVRHRGRRVGRRRQVDDGAPPARAARPLAARPRASSWSPPTASCYPNAELERRGLMARKGFPESYDRRALIRFLSEGQGRAGPRCARPGLRPPHLRHRPRRRGRGAPAGRAHRRGPQRAAAGPRRRLRRPPTSR